MHKRDKFRFPPSPGGGEKTRNPNLDQYGRDVYGKVPWYKYDSSAGCAIPLAVICVVAGFIFWPLWILAVLLFILAAVNRKR